MSRRDTIIIALLVNAGLLALLFMLAINSDDDGVIDQPGIENTIVNNRDIEPVPTNVTAIGLPDTHVNDEVDSFLNDLTDENHSRPLEVDDEGYVLLQPEAPVPVKQMVTTESQPTKETNYVEVTVKRGDALEKIARNNGTTIEAIKKANNLSSTKLSIGQVLRVPISKNNSVDNATASKAKVTPSTSSQPVAVNNTVVSSNNAAQYYTVKKGDNPWKIAKQYNINFDDLLKMNNLDEERARNMKIGDKIRVK